jgi:hypothetical protein
MKSAITFSAVWIICVVCANGEDRTIDSNIFKDGYRTTVTSEAIANTPAWNNDDDNPPLSAKRATKIAKRQVDLMTKGQEHAKWRLTSLSLESFDDGWFWLVTYKAPSPGTTLAMSLRIAILMDGTVVEPKKKTAAENNASA